MFRIVVSLTAVSLLTACATSSIRATDATPVTEDRLLAFQQKPTSFATLIVTRDTGMMGAACFTGFKINGQLAARFAPGETAQFYVEPGEAILWYGPDPMGKVLCGTHAGWYPWVQRETILTEGQTKYFRLFISFSGDMDIQRAPE